MQESDRDHELELDLHAIIGRKAYNRRNNLFYDIEERIIYNAGSRLVFLKYESNYEDEDEQSMDNEDDDFIKIT